MKCGALRVIIVDEVQLRKKKTARVRSFLHEIFWPSAEAKQVLDTLCFLNTFGELTLPCRCGRSSAPTNLVIVKISE